jgi:hypothetical protein
MLLGTCDGLMRRASGTKPIARFREGVVPAALQNLHHRLLNQSIQHRWDGKFPHPSVRLRDFHPTYRLRLIGPTDVPVLSRLGRLREPERAFPGGTGTQKTSKKGLPGGEALW